VLTSAGAVEVVTPRVNDKRVDQATGERMRFGSVVLPAWCRKSPKINEVLPLLYLHGLSSQDFAPALEGFLGTGAGLSPATITRLTVQWQEGGRVQQPRSVWRGLCVCVGRRHPCRGPCSHAASSSTSRCP
jgi:hypothetical protein